MPATNPRAGAGLWPLALALGLASCGDDGGTEPATGSIEVTATTTGSSQDPDGYTVSVDGGAAQALGINGTLTVSEVTAGDRSVALGGVAANCTVAGANPRTVTVSAGATAELTFAVTCVELPQLTGRIAFETSRTGDFEVFSMNADGTDVINLSENPATDLEPDWSPDGSLIAFVSDRDGNDEIYLMAADGSAQVRLTDDAGSDRSPEWSPDGSMIAFETDRDGNTEVYVMNADGSGQVNLTNDPSEDAHPAWSRDGSRIAFQTDRAAGGGNEVYVMNVDGGDPVNLSNNPASDGRPAWSPDDLRIAFSSTRDGNFEIYVMNADGSGQLRLTDDDELDSYPEWSPDGEHLAFRSDRAGNLEVFVMNADGSGPFNRTTHQAVDCHPTWTENVGPALRPTRRAAEAHRWREEVGRVVDAGRSPPGVPLERCAGR
jgi:Tol biopolymer transport system component